MPGLLDLPDELLIHIGRSFDSYGTSLGVSNLLRFARVNRRLRNVGNEVLYRDYATSMWAIAMAATNNNIATLELANAFGLDLHYDSESPLRIACHHGSADAVQWLLDHGADVNPRVIEYEPLGIVVAPAWASPLKAAMNSKNEDLAIMLLSRGATPFFSQYDDIRPYESEVPLVTALQQGLLNRQHRVVEFILTRNLVSVNMWTSSGHNTADLAMSVQDPNDTRMLQLLIQHGVDINRADVYGETLLTCALRGRYYDHAMLLLDHGADAVPAESVRDICHPIHAWAWSAQVEIHPHYFSLLHRLLEGGADIEETYPNGGTPLLEACRVGMPYTVSYLIGLGASINARDAHGRNVMSYLTNYTIRIEEITHQKIVILVRGGFRVDTKIAQNETLLLWAAHYGPVSRMNKPNDRNRLLLDILNELTPANITEGYLNEALGKLLYEMVWRDTGLAFLNECKMLIERGARLIDFDVARAVAQHIFSPEGWYLDDQLRQEVLGIYLTMGIPIHILAEVLKYPMMAKDRDCINMILARGVLIHTLQYRDEWVALASDMGDEDLVRQITDAHLTITQGFVKQ